jgi:hypothetical protein
LRTLCQLGLAALLLLLSPTMARGDCPDVTVEADLAEALNRAEQAYADVDDNAFQDAINLISVYSLPCLGEPLAPELAARFHRVMALHYFGAGDQDTAFQTMEIAKRADGDYQFNDRLLPPSFPLRHHYENASPTLSRHDWCQSLALEQSPLTACSPDKGP